MIYFTVALLAEAKPFIKTLKLSLRDQTPFQIYSNEHFKLIITGMGKDNAFIASSHLLTKFPPSTKDVLVNFGLAGAQTNFEIASIVLAHTLTDKSSGKTFYPDMRLIHPYKEVNLTTVNEVQTSAEKNIEAVDMEAFAVYKSALFYLKSSQILTFKLISDHFSAKIPSKEEVNDWIEPHVNTLLALLENHQSKLPEKIIFSPVLQSEIDKTITVLKLTTSQVNQFHDALKGFVLRNHKEPLLPKHLPEFVQHKKEQKDAFAKLIDLLSL